MSKHSHRDERAQHHNYCGCYRKWAMASRPEPQGQIHASRTRRTLASRFERRHLGQSATELQPVAAIEISLCLQLSN